MRQKDIKVCRFKVWNVRKPSSLTFQFQKASFVMKFSKRAQRERLPRNILHRKSTCNIHETNYLINFSMASPSKQKTRKRSIRSRTIRVIYLDLRGNSVTQHVSEGEWMNVAEKRIFHLIWTGKVFFLLLPKPNDMQSENFRDFKTNCDYEWHFLCANGKFFPFLYNFISARDKEIIYLREFPVFPSFNSNKRLNCALKILRN